MPTNKKGGSVHNWKKSYSTTTGPLVCELRVEEVSSTQHKPEDWSVDHILQCRLIAQCQCRAFDLQ